MTGLERIDLARVEVPDDLAVEVLREQIAPGASEEELRHFGRVATVLDLSPFAGQICLIGRYDRRVGHEIFKPQITVDGRRARAERTGLLDGIDGPVWCGPRDERGELVWQDVWTDDDNFPYCARTLTYRKDWSRPANGTAKWSEFSQWVSDRNGGNRLSPFWARMPSHMIGKVSEAMSLRRAFANDVAYRLAATYVGDDTASTVAEAETGTLQAAAKPEPPPTVRVREDSPPADYYDSLPEARGHLPGHAYRYDPDPGERFTR